MFGYTEELSKVKKGFKKAIPEIKNNLDFILGYWFDNKLIKALSIGKDKDWLNEQISEALEEYTLDRGYSAANLIDMDLWYSKIYSDRRKYTSKEVVKDMAKGKGCDVKERIRLLALLVASYNELNKKESFF